GGRGGPRARRGAGDRTWGLAGLRAGHRAGRRAGWWGWWRRGLRARHRAGWRRWWRGWWCGARRWRRRSAAAEGCPRAGDRVGGRIQGERDAVLAEPDHRFDPRELRPKRGSGV